MDDTWHSLSRRIDALQAEFNKQAQRLPTNAHVLQKVEEYQRSVMEAVEAVEIRQKQLEAKFDYLIDSICRAKMAEPLPVMVLPKQEGEPVTFQPPRKVDPTVAGVMRAEDRNWVKAVEEAVKAAHPPAPEGPHNNPNRVNFDGQDCPRCSCGSSGFQWVDGRWICTMCHKFRETEKG